MTLKMSQVKKCHDRIINIFLCFERLKIEYIMIHPRKYDYNNNHDRYTKIRMTNRKRSRSKRGRQYTICFVVIMYELFMFGSIVIGVLRQSILSTYFRSPSSVIANPTSIYKSSKTNLFSLAFVNHSTTTASFHQNQRNKLLSRNKKNNNNFRTVNRLPSNHEMQFSWNDNDDILYDPDNSPDYSLSFGDNFENQYLYKIQELVELSLSSVSSMKSTTSPSTIQTSITENYYEFERHILNYIWSCKDLSEIQYLIDTLLELQCLDDDLSCDDNIRESMTDDQHVQSDDPHPLTTIISVVRQQQKLISYFGPNVSSALLRRLVDFRSSLKNNRNKKYKNPTRTNRSKNNQTEQQLQLQLQKHREQEYYYKQWIKSILNYLSTQVILTLNFRQKEIINSSCDQHISPTSISSITIATLTNASLANILFSLSKTIQTKKHQKYNLQTETNEDSYNDESSNVNEIQMNIKPLVDKICECLMLPELIDATTTDTIHSSLKPNNLKSLPPNRLIEILSSLATLNINDHIQLLRDIGDRLTQGDAISRLNAYQLSIGLWSYATLNRPHLHLLKGYSRRIRKEQIRMFMKPNDICKAIWAVGRSMEQLDVLTQEKEQYRDEGMNVDVDDLMIDDDDLDEQIAILRAETQTMCYTLFKELVRPIPIMSTSRSYKEVFSRGRKDIITDYLSENRKLDALTSAQVADILNSCVIYEVDPNECILVEISNHLRDERVLRRINRVSDIARLLWSFQRLKMDNYVDTVSQLIGKFLDIVQSSESNISIKPKVMNMILRSSCLMLPNNSDAVLGLLDVASSRFFSDSSYLSQCNEYELSNFMWVLAKCEKIYPINTLRNIIKRMKHDDILSTFSPSSASKFLWSLTIIIEKYEDEKEVEELKGLSFEMFQILGGALLSSKLTPVDVVSAMWVMAKTSHSLDKGIFDHLAEVLAFDFMLQRSTRQQVATALWCCGKFISWEDPLREKMEYGEFKAPPYVDSAKKFAKHLISIIDEISPKDVAQSIWALGRLKIPDLDIISPLAHIAASMSQNKAFNSQELSNILWGLSKTGYNNISVVSVITKEVTDVSILTDLNPQEASNIMYAIAMMKSPFTDDEKMGKINDEELFSIMTSVIMNRSHEATTQTIANALWAHEIMNLKPPRLLFNKWAKETLDITGLNIEP